MRNFLLSVLMTFVTLPFFGQGFEMSPTQEMYKGSIGETVRAPLRLRNTTDKPVVVVIRKIQEQIGSTQKNFFCPDGNCLEEKVTDYVVRLEPGQTISNLQIGLEGGLVPGGSFIRYIAFNKANPAQTVEFDLNFSIEEKPQKENIYNSSKITIRDVYPNPSVDHAFVNYNLLSDRTKAKVRVHNIIGNIVGEYDLTSAETILRIKTDELNAGIYFYTIYVDNESVLTRKLIVKK